MANQLISSMPMFMGGILEYEGAEGCSGAA